MLQLVWCYNDKWNTCEFVPHITRVGFEHAAWYMRVGKLSIYWRIKKGGV